MENEKKEKTFDYKYVIIFVLAAIIIALIVVIVLSKNDTNNQSKITDATISNVAKNDVTITNKEDELNNNVTIKKVETEEETKKMEFGQTATKDDKYELTIKSSRFGKSIEPPNTSGYYRYYDASEGHQYLEIIYDYKNLTGADVRADKISSIKIKYNDKYEYLGFSIIEDSDGDFTYSNITSIAPLSIGKMHYLIEVPDEVANETLPIVATITCGQEKYSIVIR